VGKDLEKDVNIVQENLEKEEAINSRLEKQVSSFMERKKHEENIIWLKRKRACLLYKQKRDDYERAKKERDAIQKDIDAMNKEFEPMKLKKEELDKNLSKQKNTLNQKVYCLVDQICTF
jgi:hypothetical protein